MNEKIVQAENLRIYPQFASTNFISLLIKTFLISGQFDELFQDIFLGIQFGVDFDTYYESDIIFFDQQIMEDLLEKTNVFTNVFIDLNDDFETKQAISMQYFRQRLLQMTPQTNLNEDFTSKVSVDMDQIMGDVDPEHLQINDIQMVHSVDLLNEFSTSNQIAEFDFVTNVQVMRCISVKSIQKSDVKSSQSSFLETSDQKLNDIVSQTKIRTYAQSTEYLQSSSETNGDAYQRVTDTSIQENTQFSDSVPFGFNQHFEMVRFVDTIIPKVESVITKYYVRLQGEEELVSKFTYSRPFYERKLIKFVKEELAYSPQCEFSIIKTVIDTQDDNLSFPFRTENGLQIVPTLLRYNGQYVKLVSKFEDVETRIIQQNGECFRCQQSIMEDNQEIWESSYSGVVLCKDCEQSISKIPSFILYGLEGQIDGPVLQKEQQLICSLLDKPLLLEQLIFKSLNKRNEQAFLELVQVRQQFLLIVYQIRQCQNCYLCCSQYCLDLFSPTFNVKVQTKKKPDNCVAIPLYNLLGSRREYLGLLDQAVLLPFQRTGKIVIQSTGYFSLKDLLETEVVIEIIAKAMIYLQKHINSCTFCSEQFDICVCGRHLFGFENNIQICRYCGAIQCSTECSPKRNSSYCFVCFHSFQLN